MKRRHFSVAKKARIVAYYRERGAGAAMEKYKIGSSTIHRWKHEVPSDRPPRLAAPHEGMRTNSSAVRDAIIYLQHSEEALRGKPSNAELFALLALRTLTGEITK